MKISKKLPIAIMLCLFLVNIITAQKVVEENIGFYHGNSFFFEFKRTIIETDKNIIIAKDNLIKRYDKAGELDESFGNMGVLEIDAVTRLEIRGIFLADDDLVVISTKNDHTSFKQFIYDGQGQTLKSSYVFETPFTHQFYDVILQRDKKILLVGTHTDEDSNHFYFAIRLTTEGHIDSTFQIEFPIKENHIWDNHSLTTVIQRADGKLLIAGVENDEINLSLYHLDGSIDPSFGDKGKVLINANQSFSAPIQNIHLVNNKIVVTGSVKGFNATNSDNGQYFFVSRFLANGQIDTTFADNGIAIHVRDENDIKFEQLQTSIILEDGKILLIGHRSKDHDLNLTQGLLVQYNEDGSLDQSFMTDGKFDLTILNNTDIIHVSPSENDYTLFFTGIDAEDLSGIPLDFSSLYMTALITDFKTSNSEVENFEIPHFYPNPVISDATIKYQLSEKSTIEIQLFDMSGKVIGVPLTEHATAGAHTRKIDLQKLPKGSYFLNVIADNRKNVIKFVKY